MQRPIASFFYHIESRIKKSVIEGVLWCMIRRTKSSCHKERSDTPKWVDIEIGPNDTNFEYSPLNMTESGQSRSGAAVAEIPKIALSGKIQSYYILDHITLYYHYY